MLLREGRLMNIFGKTDRRILSILIPVILENALLTLSGMILTGYIGRLTVTEISAYGLGRRVYGIYYSLFKGLAVGTMVNAAKAVGTGDEERCARIQQESYLMDLPIAVLIAVLITLGAPLILSVMTSDAVLIEQGARVLRFTAPLYPLLAVIHLNTAAFQAHGNTRTPMVIAAIGNLVTITAGYVLIFGLGPLKGLGIMGAVLGQNLSFIVMAGIGLFLLYGKHGLFVHTKMNLFHLPDIKDAKEIFSTGIPVSLEDTFWQAATVVISAVILSYGQEYYAAYQLGLEGEGFCNMMSAGFMTAAMSLSAQAIGRRDAQEYEECYRRLCLFCMMISCITMTFLLFCSKPVLHLMTDKPQLVSIASVYMYAMIFSQIPQHMKQIQVGYLRSAGHTGTTMTINLIGLWAVRVPLVLLFARVMHLDILFIWIAFDIDMWVRLLLSWYKLRSLHVHSYIEQLQGKEA